MHMYLGELEAFLNGHLAILQPAAAAPRADARTVMDKLVSAIATIRRSGSSAGAGGTGVSSVAGGTATGGATAVNNDAVEAVRWTQLQHHGALSVHTRSAARILLSVMHLKSQAASQQAARVLDEQRRIGDECERSVRAIGD